MKNKYTIFLTSLLFLCGSANAKTPGQHSGIQAAIAKCQGNQQCVTKVQQAGKKCTGNEQVCETELMAIANQMTTF